MAKVEESVQIHAPPDTVWKIVSDLDAEPVYWKGTKSVRNISSDTNVVKREITIAFRDKKCMQTVRPDPPHSIHYEFTKGIIRGSKTITLAGDQDTTLTASWNIHMTGMMSIFSGAITGHIREGTKKALHSIKDAAETTLDT